jgi:uncharacterized protein (TIGR03382 family)
VEQLDGGSYIVVLRDGRSTDRVAAAYGLTPHRRYSHALGGFAARMPAALAQRLASDPDVVLVEPVQTFHATATEANATWGLDRIDQRALPLDTSYTYATNGAGSTVFVIDSGILSTHVDFASRVDTGKGGTAIDDGYGSEDCNGHGTHVAGTIGGSILGVAKGATLVPIRVLDCNGSGPTDGILAGIDFVAANHPARSVANLSLGGAASPALDVAIQNLVASGVTVVVAAGNENQDACNVSPAREPSAITVAASTVTDTRASFSNWGRCVDLFAPGMDITSAWITSDTSTNTISGTSMASPHVAGAAALYLAQQPAATPAQVSAALVAAATPDRVAGVAGSPNKLLYVGAEAAPPPPSSPLRITAPAAGAQVMPTFVVSVEASDAVTLSVDGFTVATDSAAPYSFQVTNALAGSHVVSVTSGGSTESVTVTVQASGFPPLGGDLGGNGGWGGGTGSGSGSDGDAVPDPVPPGDEAVGCNAAGTPGLLVVLVAVAMRRRRRHGVACTRSARMRV